MVNAIRKISLRTRLALLAGFAVLALLVALFVAWRLARASETFAMRQADSSVRAASRDLAREVQLNPDGYLTIDQAMPHPHDGQREKAPPPHVQTLFAAYVDPFARLTAITLHRYPEVEGGFYRASDQVLLGYPNQKASPPDLTGPIEKAVNKTDTTGTATTQLIQLGSERVLLSTYPIEGDRITAAWAIQRLPLTSGFSDWPNLAALIALALSIVAVSGLAFITVRDLRTGVTAIETGLAELKTDLSREVKNPNTAELARIAAAINQLATTLRSNIALQAELQRELRQSERLSALGRVVAGVAHEVRNPLSAIKLKVQLAQRSSYSKEKLDETFGVIRAEIERLDSLVRRLLELGTQHRVENLPINIADLVSQRAAFFNDLATQAGIVLTINKCPDTITIAGDQNRLAQVFDNLIQNAFDAMPTGGRLTISCNVIYREDGSEAVSLNFEDTGHGISESDQDHIFEPFHTSRATGTGLGLAIARSIIEEHGGLIDFMSNRESGTSFVISLPATTKTS